VPRVLKGRTGIPMADTMHPPASAPPLDDEPAARRTGVTSLAPNSKDTQAQKSRQGPSDTVVGTVGLIVTFAGFWVVSAGIFMWLNQISSVVNSFRAGKKEGGNLKDLVMILFPGMRVRIAIAVVVAGIVLLRSQMRKKNKVH
jgi:hypothetical protein